MPNNFFFNFKSYNSVYALIQYYWYRKNNNNLLATMTLIIGLCTELRTPALQAQGFNLIL